jgi:hypothetical protein
MLAEDVGDCAIGVLGAALAGGAYEGDGVIEQQLCGTMPFGADTPATSDPSPNFCSVSASSFPVTSSPFADWNFCTASTVSASHFPEGSVP